MNKLKSNLCILHEDKNLQYIKGKKANHKAIHPQKCNVIPSILSSKMQKLNSFTDFTGL